MTTVYAITTKKATPLSTRALAAFLTWKQFDLLLLLETEGPSATRVLSEDLEEIHAYDKKHSGAFYTGISTSATYSSLRTLEDRQLVHRHTGRNGLIEWTIKARGTQALQWLEAN